MTSGLWARRASRLLHPAILYFVKITSIKLITMGRGGFEPPKQFAADLQSVPFGHSGICPFLSAQISWQGLIITYHFSLCKIRFYILSLTTSNAWDLSSAGRASALQAEGHRFEPYRSHLRQLNIAYARVAELADAQDLKSCCGDTVPVRFRSPALQFIYSELQKMNMCA